MGPHVLTTEKIPLTQAIWQVFEIGMNAVILFTMLSAGFNGVAWYAASALALWQAFEVFMNTWILFTMFKVGIKTRTKPVEMEIIQVPTLIPAQPQAPRTPYLASCEDCVRGLPHGTTGRTYNTYGS